MRNFHLLNNLITICFSYEEIPKYFKKIRYKFKELNSVAYLIKFFTQHHPTSQFPDMIADRKKIKES